LLIKELPLLEESGTLAATELEIVEVDDEAEVGAFELLFKTVVPQISRKHSIKGMNRIVTEDRDDNCLLSSIFSAGW
jgi:hypothetical protein